MSERLTGDTPLTRFLALQSLTQLRTIRAEYRAEIDLAKARAAALEDEVALVDQAISERAATRDSSPSRNGRKPRTGPSLRIAILNVVSDRPGPWGRQEIWDELDRLDQAPHGKNPRNTFGNRLTEMVASGELGREGDGYFVTQRGRTLAAEKGRSKST